MLRKRPKLLTADSLPGTMVPLEQTPRPISDTHGAVHAASLLIRSARYLTAFAGAGISAESGVPITQNIDNPRHLAGSRLCPSCGQRVAARPTPRAGLPPRCSCEGVCKPDFVWFGEGVPRAAHAKSRRQAGKSDLMLVIASTDEIYPAALVPRLAKKVGAKIIEVNPDEPEFCASVTGVYIPLAAEALGLNEKEFAS